MRGGAIIGLPLTLLQLGVHHSHPGVVDPLLVANNFVVSNAIYTADRLDADASWSDRASTRVSALASSAFYASCPATTSLVPAVLGLHFFYTSLKPLLAPLKPFVVALFWTLAVYDVPLLRHPEVASSWDPSFDAAFFLSIAALSHVADIVDVEEDRTNRVYTPAVIMGDDGAPYALALGLASALLHSTSQDPFIVYDFVVLSTIAGIIYDQVTICVSASVCFCLVYANTHDVEVLTLMLRSSEGVHKLAITLSTTFIEEAFRLPEPYRSAIVKLVLVATEQGDNVGHQILELFQTRILDRLQDMQ